MKICLLIFAFATAVPILNKTLSMVATSVASFLLVLALAVGKQYAAADTTISGSEDASLVVNVATVAFNSVHENLSSVAEEMAMQGTPNDFVLVGNTSFSDMWLDGVAGYSAAADSRVVYQTTNWTLLEDGAQYETFPMFWARFQAAKSSATASSLLSICTMVVDWQNVSESAAAFGAVKVEDRLKDNCKENDTIALLFTSTITNTVIQYLEGEVAVNDAMATIPMQRVNKSMLLEPSSTTDKRFFVRLGSDVCPADASTLARSVSSAASSEIMAISLQSGEYCADDSKYMPPHVPSEGSGSISSDDSDWKHDLRFIIPISVCMFLLGCAGLVYVLRQQKNAPSETPKDDAKGIITSLPYVLSMHPLV